MENIHTVHYNCDDLEPPMSFIVSFSLPYYTSVINSHTEYHFHSTSKVKIRKNLL